MILMIPLAFLWVVLFNGFLRDLFSGFNNIDGEEAFLLIVLGLGIPSGYIYILGTLPKLANPEELHSDLLDTDTVKVNTEPLTRIQRLCGIIHTLMTLAFALFLFYNIFANIGSIEDLERLIILFAITMVMTLLVIISPAYVYRSWQTVSKLNKSK